VISKACFLNDCLLGKKYAECAKRVAGHNSCVPQTGEIKQIKQYFTWTGMLFTRWDEKAGLRGMRYAPNVRRARGAIEKETGYEKD
jgi:hypothetical protein